MELNDTFLFGEKFQSFKNIFDNNINQLKKQLDKEELHECDSKSCLAVLKKQFETFFYPKSPLSYSYQYQSNLARQKEIFQEYAHYDIESLKKTILYYLNSIEKRIDERACHEEELRIKEQNVKERRNNVKRLNDTDVEGAKISKNDSDDDITITKSSHDKDKTEVQWSNNGLFENDHELEKTNENNKALKEANDFLTKELKTYKEKVQVFEMNKGNNTTYFNEYIEADRKAKRFENESQSQFIRDRDIIRDLEQQRDKLQLQNSYQKCQISSLQAKNKDLENVICNMGKSTETLRLLTNEQRAYQDNTRKSGLGYKGPCVLSQANAKIPKFYSAYELRDENVQLHVFGSEETLEDAEKSRFKMKEFQKDEKVQELKIKPIDYTKLNNLHETFVPQVELSLEQKYFSETFISSETPSNASISKSPCAQMPSANPMLVDLNKMENDLKTLFELLQTHSKRESIFYTSPEEIRLTKFCQQEVKPILHTDLDKTLKQKEILKDRLLEVTLAEDVKNLVITSCVEIGNKNLQDKIKRISKESKDVSNESKTADTFCNDAFDVTEKMSKRIVDLEKDLSNLEAKSIAFEIALQHKSQENNYLKILQKENENFMASFQIENAHLKQTYKDLLESV
ncbi:hypothetical protein Tco_0045926 [Tanacetum coccineum]